MNYSCKWQSYSGSNTEDNRDYCGIATCSNTTFFVIADGSTDSHQGSELAQRLVVSLLEKFRSGPENPSAGTVTSWCRATHAELRFHYPAASASYLIGIARENGTWITLHAGDCLLGTINHDGIIQWHLQPHTLANATGPVPHKELSKSPIRHSLTRSFRARIFMKPECNTFMFSTTEKIILASDGFWAGLSQMEQEQSLKDQLKQNGGTDDTSFLLVRKHTPGKAPVTIHSENIAIIKNGS